MSTLKLLQFSGEIPRILPRLLPDTASQYAENVRLDDGGLTPVRKTRLEHAVVGVNPIASIYKFGASWLAWSTKVNAAPGPVATDRLYYTGDGVPKMRVGATVYPLKVTAPSTALTATLGGSGSGAITTRLYVYTFVTSMGEESEPCPISNAIDWQVGKTVTLSGFAAAPAGRAITLQRIYRSQSSVSAGTDLFLIAERAAVATDYADTVAVDGFSEVLPSRDWNPPPDTLSGLISLPNGMMAGFVGKDIYFCEPYRPHAWPQKYVLTVDYPVVALGASGTLFAVMTTGLPYIVNGNAPENMQQERLELNLPCINANGVVDLGYAIAYPSYDGLVVIRGGRATVETAALMTRSDWLKTAPATFVAGQYSGRYIASYEYVDAGMPITGSLIFDLSDGTPFVLRSSKRANAYFYDIPSSALYMLIGDTIYEHDALGMDSEVMSWYSKEFVLPAPVSYGCILIESARAMTPAEIAALQAAIAAIDAQNAIYQLLPTLGGEINGSLFNTYEVNGDILLDRPTSTFVSVSIYADNELLATVSSENTLVRLPPKNARTWEVRVNGNMALAQITLATTPKELNGQ